MTVDTDKALTPISQAQRMLAEAKTVDQLTSLRDYAEGARAWAKARGMGVDAENQAAEVILRAELAIGDIINVARDEGRMVVPGQWKQRLPTTAAGEPIEATSLADKMTVAEFLAVDPKSATLRYAFDWMRIAREPRDLFEAMLRSAHESGQRISRMSFWRGRQMYGKGTVLNPSPETNEDPDFVKFRSGAYGLLGYRINEDGDAEYTRNGLTQLPDDELREAAGLLTRLAGAYAIARNERRG